LHVIVALGVISCQLMLGYRNSRRGLETWVSP